MATTQNLSIDYPLHWRCHRNPLADRVGRRVREWGQAFLREHAQQPGAPRVADLRKRVHELNIAGYGGWPLPHADGERLYTICQFFTMWIFYDDNFEHGGPGFFEEMYEAILQDSDTPPAGFWPRMWHSLCRGYRHMPRQWRVRLATDFQGWLFSIAEERAMRRGFWATGEVPSVAEYLRVRNVSIGQIPAANFIEFAEGFVLPEAIEASEQAQALVRQSALLVTLLQDLHSIDKDARDRFPNLVELYGREHELTRLETFTSYRRWMCDEIVAFDRMAEQLHARVADDHERRQTVEFDDVDELVELVELVDRWTDGLRHMVYGFHRWHLEADRYSRRYRLDDTNVVITLDTM
ncbi:MAG TPA: hypothetical protein VK034_01575 [Enhygromyxa sp.]|nr:hypothetical protein [Enhygromyxa sp.]